MQCFATHHCLLSQSPSTRSFTSTVGADLHPDLLSLGLARPPLFVPSVMVSSMRIGLLLTHIHFVQNRGRSGAHE